MQMFLFFLRLEVNRNWTRFPLKCHLGFFAEDQSVDLDDFKQIWAFLGTFVPTRGAEFWSAKTDFVNFGKFLDYIAQFCLKSPSTKLDWIKYGIVPKMPHN